MVFDIALAAAAISNNATRRGDEWDATLSRENPKSADDDVRRGERLSEWLVEHQETLDGSYFYSDSHNDLPLLRKVDHPVAVDPDPTLERHARELGWPILSLRAPS